jgi:hypothetical protein
MSHLIYDEIGELIDVMDFDNAPALAAYKKSNPVYSVLMTDELNDLSFIDDEEIDLDIDEEPLW